MMTRRPLFIAFFSFFVLNFVAAPPVLESNAKTTLSPLKEQETDKWGLEYEKYVKEVISVLESDPVFVEKVKNASEEDVKSGKIAHLLDFVGHDLRTKLDELKRVELEKLRFYADEKEKLRDTNDLPGHLGHEKPNFDEKDLKALMLQTSKDLEIINLKIEQERKREAMKLEYENRRRKGNLSGQELENALKEEELAKHQAQDVKMNHPMDKDQLREVWEEEDKLPVDDFDAKTFFNLHDLDGNGFLDELELKAIFQNDLDKVYNDTDDPMDMNRREDEAESMRKHVLGELDKNKDSLISLEEFLQNEKTADYDEKGADWQPSNSSFSEQEYEKFVKEQEQIAPVTPQQQLGVSKT